MVSSSANISLLSQMRRAAKKAEIKRHGAQHRRCHVILVFPKHRRWLYRHWLRIAVASWSLTM